MDETKYLRNHKTRACKNSKLEGKTNNRTDPNEQYPKKVAAIHHGKEKELLAKQKALLQKEGINFTV